MDPFEKLWNFSPEQSLGLDELLRLDDDLIFDFDESQKEEVRHELAFLDEIGGSGSELPEPPELPQPAPAPITFPATATFGLETLDNQTYLYGSFSYQFKLDQLQSIPIGGSVLQTCETTFNMGKPVPSPDEEETGGTVISSEVPAGQPGTFPASSAVPQGQEDRGEQPGGSIIEKFKCSSCGYTADTRSMVKRHQKVHANATVPCRVPGCAAMFRVEATRTKHETDQHQIQH